MEVTGAVSIPPNRSLPAGGRFTFVRTLEGAASEIDMTHIQGAEVSMRDCRKVY